MSKSRRIRLSEIRQVFRIYHEACELGGDPHAWRDHVVSALGDFFRARTSMTGTMPLAPSPDHLDIFVSVHRSPDATEQRIWDEYGSRGDVSRDPCTPWVLANAPRGFVVSRRAMCDDRTWYASDYFNDFRRAVRCDESLMTIIPLPQLGVMSVIGFCNTIGDPHYGRKEVTLLGLFGGELRRAWERQVAARNTATPPGPPLSPRLMEVLAHLRGPLSEKQIAARMGLSRGTVHKYVTALYRRFDVTSRAELLHLDSDRKPLNPRLGVLGL